MHPIELWSFWWYNHINLISGRPLSADELRILNIVLVEYVDQLNNVGLYIKAAIADQPATDQPVVTKKRVAECLQQIGQQELAEILITSQGEFSQRIS